MTKDSLRRAAEKLGLMEKAMDHNGDLVSLVTPRILELLEQGLGDRVTLIQPQLCPLHSVSRLLKTPKNKERNS
jgi:hypothetical protein